MNKMKQAEEERVLFLDQKCSYCSSLLNYSCWVWALWLGSSNYMDSCLIKENELHMVTFMSQRACICFSNVTDGDRRKKM